MIVTTFKKYDVHKNIFQKDENGREINIYKFDNSLLTGHNLYYPNVLLKTNNELILPLLEKTMSLNTVTIYEKNDMKYDYIENKITKRIIEPVFFFIYNTDNYFHYLYDSLPYLISYLQLKKEMSDLKLLMQYPNEQKNEFYPFVLEFLKILNIEKSDIIIVDNTTHFNEIFVSTSYTHDVDSNLPPRKEIYNFYQNMVKIVKKREQYETPKKIYVSRRTWLHNDFSNIGTNYTTRRKLVNEDELVEKLKQQGFVEVFTENLTTIQKIQYFANATHVTGAIGGGISNVLFSSKITKLEAFISPTFLEVNQRFKYSLDCVDVYYNMNTKHVEENEFKTYMRVKTKDEKIMGEIEEIYDNKLLVSYTDGSITGWNSQSTYKKIELEMNSVEKLDNGLNSPWIIKI